MTIPPPIPPWIECPECGGRASLLTFLPEGDPEAEAPEVVAYRCADCMERFDVVMSEDEADENG